MLALNSKGIKNFAGMQHRGKIIEAAVRDSGLSISRVAELLGKSRRWMYLLFESEHVSLDHVLRIGQIIHHDFSSDLSELRDLADRSDMLRQNGENVHDYLYWKLKYYQLLEEYYQLSRKWQARMMMEGKM